MNKFEAARLIKAFEDAEPLHKAIVLVTLFPPVEDHKPTNVIPFARGGPHENQTSLEPNN